MSLAPGAQGVYADYVMDESRHWQGISTLPVSLALQPGRLACSLTLRTPLRRSDSAAHRTFLRVCSPSGGRLP
jgi:hypothetical protein